jgi:hypothetical protein
MKNKNITNLLKKIYNYKELNDEDTDLIQKLLEE